MPITHFTSDQHFGHANVIRYDRRPFRDCDHMQREIVARYNSVVGASDMVLWLGDAFFGKTKDEATAILESMNGRKILLRGNHDRKSKTWFRDAGFDFVGDNYLIEDPTIGPIFCTHNPLKSATVSGINAVIHGHKHSTEPMPRGPRSRWIDVGVCAWNFYPVKYETVIEMLKGNE